MLSKQALEAINRMMRIGCFLKFYPYGWDSKKYQLMPGTKFQVFCFRVHTVTNFCVWWFINFRFLQTIKDPIPNSLRITHFVWVIAFGLSFACNLQFHKRKDEIRNFTNAMFAAFEEMQTKKETRGKGIWKWYSRVVLLSAFMIYTNPTIHAAVLVYGPCAPMYISSMILDCPAPLSLPITRLESIPYVIWENYLIADNIFRWSFNWTLIYLGFQYVTEIMKMENLPGVTKIDPGKYRLCQLLVIMINDSFGYYLEYFPSVLFTIAGMMMFCAIRYTYYTILLYLVFPFCALRCLYEAVTALQAAGKLNEESATFLKKWGKKMTAIEDPEEQKYIATFYKSCRNLQCNAGPLYTFENSIVLVSLYHCSQLTFNMLCTYKD